MIAVREYTDAAAMISDAKALRARLYAKHPEPLSPPPPPAPQEPRITITQRERIEAEAAFRKWLSLSTVTAQHPWKTVCKVVTERTGISLAYLKGETRVARFVHARQITCWLLRKHTDMSLPTIGQRLGNRDHTTILHACRKVQALRDSDTAFRNLLDELSATISERLSSES
jgi:hypothetical protein